MGSDINTNDVIIMTTATKIQTEIYYTICFNLKSDDYKEQPDVRGCVGK